MKCIDHEVPIAVSTDMLTQRIFTITEQGLFSAFDLLTFDIIYQKNFLKTALNVIAFKTSSKVLLVFQNDI